MGFKNVMKKIGKGALKALPVAEIFFPQLEILEKLGKVKNLTGPEKQQLALDLFKSDLLDNLLPEDVDKFKNDPIFEQKTKTAIDAVIDLENYVQSKVGK